MGRLVCNAWLVMAAPGVLRQLPWQHCQLLSQQSSDMSEGRTRTSNARVCQRSDLGCCTRHTGNALRISRSVLAP